MTVMSPEDTGELENLADQLRRLDHDPRHPGLIDIILLAVTITASVVVTICWVSLVIAPDHYPVDGGRVLLTSGSAASIIAAMFAGMFSMNRTHRRRHAQLVNEIRRGRCVAAPAERTNRGRLVQEVLKAVDRRAPETRKLSRSEYWEVYQDVMADLGDMPPEE